MAIDGEVSFGAGGAGHARRVDVHVHAKMRSGPPPAPKGANTKSPRPVAWVGAWTRRKQAPDRRRHPPGHLGVRNSTRLHARKRHQAGSARTCATPGEARVALARAG